MILRWLSVAALCTAAALAQPAPAPNSQPNPYRTVEHWYQLPEGRTMGSSSSVAVTPDGHIWVVDRCGANNCSASGLAPVFEFAPTGKLLRNFGAGMFAFPHSITFDKDGNFWIADQARPGSNRGNVVVKFSPDGKVLMTLGKPGVAGDGPDTFNQPNSVAIAPNGDIFVSDGHNVGRGNARVIKFTPEGKFIKQWGGHGSGPGQFEMPHALAFDSKGRLFVADRGNNRIQIFDQEGNFLAEWKQFSRPSGIYIDRNDVIYVADSESTDKEGYGNNPGWKRGIRVGSAKDGSVTAFIPDPSPGTAITSAAEGVTADADGNIYGAEVGPKDVKKYVKR
ncbi:MAG TPA: peptidyl-alpha-hydroxyglycine alpha-amidating lyase family protein [Bryobacteraceae bacterium]|nr:peptidyl-alpha-hydroxyglycine alpha-amidating lyase family protein [Bryobacteraceae bacterium]